MKKTSMLLMLLLALTMNSYHVFAQSVTITLMPGWNWISIPLMDTLDFETALGSFTPVAGDMIKSQWSTASYKNGQWRGPISHFYPGYGYMYKSNRSMPVTVTFNAQQPAPQVVVTTLEPTNITMSSAVCGGNVASSNGDYVTVTLRGICWSNNPNPTFNDNYIEVENAIGSFTISMTELPPSTTYYIRAFAVTATGTYYGEEFSFTTLDHDRVDLGLPSGTLWATCNIGAFADWVSGSYFAWGETETKGIYDWSTYQYCNGSENTLTKYCNDASYGHNGFTDSLTILQPDDDAATAKWGSDWRTPTHEDWQELLDNTTRIWTTSSNGTKGFIFRGSNGNSIFLPVTDMRPSSTYPGYYTSGLYWSSSLSTELPYNAKNFCFFSEACYIGDLPRYYGLVIRPVRSASQN
jgi:hypothetical protein